MLSYLVAYGLLIHLLFWGAGLALFAMPKPWKRMWPLLAPAAGLFLQSLVVWLGAYLNLKGTNSYAWPSEIIPSILLIAALKYTKPTWVKDILRLSGVFLIMAVALFCTVRPMTQAAPGLTTLSLGSCDAADYAGGARALMEFSRSSRTGFLGLTEVVKVMSVDNFSDYFLKLNHFTPSALIAFNGTIFHCAPYELISLFTAVSMVLVLPVVFWCARSLFKLRVIPSLILCALYGFSPTVLYAVYNVAIGQLYAAIAIAWVSWAGVKLWKYKYKLKLQYSFTLLLVTAYGIILGSYNFIVIVTLVPCIAYVCLDIVTEGNRKHLMTWIWLLSMPLLISGILFWDRVVGLLERFILLRTFDEGWKIPAFSPEGWLGLVHGPSLSAYSLNYRLLLSGFVLSLLMIGLVRLIKTGKQQMILVLSFVAPIVVGYSYLIFRGMELKTNASYDGYKLFSVFYPVVLPALVCWLPRKRFTFSLYSGTTYGLLLALFAGNLLGAKEMWAATRVAPLVVGRDLIEIKELEAHPEVNSVNMLIPDMWSRLWANYFLIKVPQYFVTHTYEARLNTVLRGEWHLIGGIFQTEIPRHASVRFNSHFSIIRLADSQSMWIEPEDGWYDIEKLPRSIETWRWASIRSSVKVVNPHSEPLHVSLKLDSDSLIDQTISVYISGVKRAELYSGPKRKKITSLELIIPAGTSHLELIAEHTPPQASETDPRLLAFRVYGFVIHVLP
jgi:hypothetical protein